MISQDKIENISIQVIKTLYKRFESFPEDASGIRNAPFHMAFLKAFQDRLEEHVSNIPVFISLSSWFHGLNTTLGQIFFEKTSHILSDGIKRDFKGLKISQLQQTTISDLIAELKNNVSSPNVLRENQLISNENDSLSKDIANFSADCFFEDIDRIVAIEIKTVKPNSGVFKTEKEKILYAKAGLKNLFPDKNIFYYIAFPFDPTSPIPTGSDKGRFMNYSVDFKKFFSAEEVLLADEFWNFLSGHHDTMNQIINIINSIASPEFMENYDFLNNFNNRILNKKKYIQLLTEWNLISELRLIENETLLLKCIENDNRMMRKFNQTIFLKDGEYNESRYNSLVNHIKDFKN